MRSTRAAALLVLAVLGALGLTGVVGAPADARPEVTVGELRPLGEPCGPVVPGGSCVSEARVTNAGDRAMTVALTAVADADVPGCFVVAADPTHATVHAGASVPVTVTLTLRAGAPDACQGTAVGVGLDVVASG